MAADYSFREFQENQQRTLDQSVRAHQAYLEALEASRPSRRHALEEDHGQGILI